MAKIEKVVDVAAVAALEAARELSADELAAKAANDEDAKAITAADVASKLDVPLEVDEEILPVLAGDMAGPETLKPGLGTLLKVEVNRGGIKEFQLWRRATKD